MGHRNPWLAAIALSLAGSHLASAAEVTRTPNLTGFTQVEAKRAYEVEIRQGASYRVEIRADEHVIDDLDVSVSGNRLTLDKHGRGWFDYDSHVRAIITMPTLAEYHGSGATRAGISGFHSEAPVELHLSGASRLEADFESADVRLDLSGASRVNLRGRGRAVRLDSSGASRADLGSFTAERADIHLSGASRATVNTEGRLDVHASGASRVNHIGHPVMGTIETSGASSIRSAN